MRCRSGLSTIRIVIFGLGMSTAAMQGCGGAGAQAKSEPNVVELEPASPKDAPEISRSVGVPGG